MNNKIKKLLVTCISLAAISKIVLAGLPMSVDGESLPTLAPMLEKVTPSVVNIATSGTVVQQSPLFNDPFFRKFFDVPQHHAASSGHCGPDQPGRLSRPTQR